MLIIDKEINHALHGALSGTKSTLDMIAYSIAPPRKGNHKLFINTWQSIEMAIKRGVKTRVLLENWLPNNPQALSQQAVFGHLTALGASVRFAKVGCIMHSKTWQFDKKLVIIGSHNSTEAGLTKTKNISVLVEDPLVNQQYNAYFETQWLKAAPMLTH